MTETLQKAMNTNQSIKDRLLKFNNYMINKIRTRRKTGYEQNKKYTYIKVEGDSKDYAVLPVDGNADDYSYIELEKLDLEEYGWNLKEEISIYITEDKITITKGKDNLKE